MGELVTTEEMLDAAYVRIAELEAELEAENLKVLNLGGRIREALERAQALAEDFSRDGHHDCAADLQRIVDEALSGGDEDA
jgi:hypothetical protein